jgi:outer membrane protein assembly factor BamB
LIVGDSDVFGLDPATGAIAWTFSPSPVSQPGWRRLASDGDAVYCGGGYYGFLYALDGASGRERWRVKVSPDSEVGVVNPVVRDGIVYAGYINDQVTGPGASARVIGGVIAVQAATGSVLWNRILPKPSADLSSGTYGVAAAPGVVVAGTKDGHVYLLAAATGLVLVTVAPDQLVVPPATPSLPDAEKVIAIAGDTVVVASVSQTSIAAFLLPSMQRIWITKSVDGSPRDMVLRPPYAFVASASGGASVWRLATGKLIYSLPGKDISAFGAPTPTATGFYVAGMDTLLALRWPD